MHVISVEQNNPIEELCDQTRISKITEMLFTF